jgi:cysteine desulfurase
LASRSTGPSTGSSFARPARTPGLPAVLGGRAPARRVYLDYAGFSPVDPRVLAVMRPFLEGWVGNPSAPHGLGGEARDSLASARAKVGRLVGGRPEGVLFVSGATEANNLAVKGMSELGRGRHVVTTAIEHPSVLGPCRDLQRAGIEVTYLPVDREGRVDPEALERALRPDTALVTIGAANGEVGAIQPWRALARVTRSHGVPFHVDGVGLVGRVPVGVEADGIDLLTVGANDIGGPPGVGALWIRPGTRVAPQLLGGAQEAGFRAGTENLAGAVGLGVAADLALREGLAEAPRLARLRDRLRDRLLAEAGVPGARLLGPQEDRLPHHLSLAFPDVEADRLLQALDLAGVSVSAGSPGAHLAGQPSPVLLALGLGPREAAGAVVMTMGRWTTDEDMDLVARELPPLARRLREATGT